MYLDSVQHDQVEMVVKRVWAARWEKRRRLVDRLCNTSYVCLVIGLIWVVHNVIYGIFSLGSAGLCVAALFGCLWLTEHVARTLMCQWPPDEEIHTQVTAEIEALPQLDEHEAWVLNGLLEGCEANDSLVVEEMLGYARITYRLGRWKLLPWFHELASVLRHTEQQRSEA